MKYNLLQDNHLNPLFLLSTRLIHLHLLLHIVPTVQEVHMTHITQEILIAPIVQILQMMIYFLQLDKLLLFLNHQYHYLLNMNLLLSFHLNMIIHHLLLLTKKIHLLHLHVVWLLHFLLQLLFHNLLVRHLLLIEQ